MSSRIRCLASFTLGCSSGSAFFQSSVDSVLTATATDPVRTIDFHFTDPGSSDGSTADPSRWDGTVECGQGSTITRTWAPGAGNLATCNYPIPGTYTITVTIRDKDGGVGIDTIKVRIR